MTTPVSPVPQPPERPAAVLALRQALLDKKPDDGADMPQEDESPMPELFQELEQSSDPDDSPEQPNDEA